MAQGSEISVEKLDKLMKSMCQYVNDLHNNFAVKAVECIDNCGFTGDKKVKLEAANNGLRDALKVVIEKIGSDEHETEGSIYGTFKEVLADWRGYDESDNFSSTSTAADEAMSAASRLSSGRKPRA